MTKAAFKYVPLITALEGVCAGVYLSLCNTYCVTMGDMTHDEREQGSEATNDTSKEENIIIFDDEVVA